MSVSRCDVGKLALSNDVDHPAIRQSVTGNIFTCFLFVNGGFFKPCHINFHIKVTRICKDRSVLHLKHMLYSDRMPASCRRDKNVPKRCCLCHSHYVISVHFCFHSLDGIYFRDDDVCSKCCCTHGYPAAAPAISNNNNCLACNDQIGIVHDAVPHTLPCTVTVIEQVLAVRIVYSNHRKFQNSFTRHCLEPDNSGSSFFASAPAFLSKVRARSVNHSNKIPAVVYDYIRLVFKTHLDVPAVFFLCRSMICKNRNPVSGKRCTHIILSAEIVAARY